MKSCPDCGSECRLRNSRFGKFFGCTRYPDCTGLRKADKNGRFVVGPPKKILDRSGQERAHEYFDRIWKTGPDTRDRAYAWMAAALSLPGPHAHINLFGFDTCLDLAGYVMEDYPHLITDDECGQIRAALGQREMEDRKHA